MAIYTASVTTTAGSTTLPSAGIYQGGTTNNSIKVRAIEVLAETVTAVTEYALRRSTSALSGAGAGQIEFPLDPGDQAAAASVATTWTSPPGDITAGTLRKFAIGAGVGSGVLFRFPLGGEIVIPRDLGAGLFVVLTAGTGQILTVNFEWEEVVL